MRDACVWRREEKNLEKSRKLEKREKEYVLFFCFSLGILFVTAAAAHVGAALRGPLGAADVVDSEQQTGALDGRLDALQLDSLGLPDAEVVHVNDFSEVA